MSEIALHHIALNCKDRLAQERFYTNHFGFRRVKVFNPGQPNEFVMLRAGQTCLELFSTPSNEFSGAGRRVGFKHMCFEVDDVASKLESMRGEVTVTWETEDRSDQMPGLTICFFKDPEGNFIELLRGWQDEESPPEISSP